MPRPTRARASSCPTQGVHRATPALAGSFRLLSSGKGPQPLSSRERDSRRPRVSGQAPDEPIPGGAAVVAGDTLASVIRSRLPDPIQLVPSLVALLAIVLLALLPDLGPTVATENQPVRAFHGRIVAIVDAQGDEPLRPPTARV